MIWHILGYLAIFFGGFEVVSTIVWIMLGHYAAALRELAYSICFFLCAIVLLS